MSLFTAVPRAPKRDAGIPIGDIIGHAHGQHSSFRRRWRADRARGDRRRRGGLRGRRGDPGLPHRHRGRDRVVARDLAARTPLIAPALGGAPGSAAARLAIRVAYLWRHHRLPRLDAPILFTERVQHRKLHDRDPRLPRLADKITAKAFAAERLGADWVTPTLWQGTELPPAPNWPTPFVLKSRHGCNQVRIMTADDPAAWASVRTDAARWMRARYGAWLGEWLYALVPRGLLVEPFIGEHGVRPIDYKVFVFGGHAAFVQVHLDRGGDHRWILFDRHWHRVSAPTSDPDPAPPLALASMLHAAERLGAGFAFVRVDLYDTAAGPRFGEMTFYPGSGLDRFAPVALDAVLGDHWARAARELGGPEARQVA